MRRNDERNDQTDLQRSVEVRGLHTRNMEKNTYKSDLQEKGNVEEVGNHRPICTLPALYKLFSAIIHNRLYNRLDQAQSEDQGGFRRSYQTLEPLPDILTDGTEMLGVRYQNVDRDSGLHEGI